MKKNEPDGTTSTHKKVKKKSVLRVFWKTFCFLSLTFFIVFLIVGGWALKKGMSMYEQTDISKLGKEPPRPTVIYDISGNVVTELSSSRMAYIPYDKFPKSIVDAIISVED